MKIINDGWPLDLRLLRTFITVADERHFSRAANRLNATQSAVSLQVRELERRLGVALLVRDRRNVTLTSAGEVLRAEGLILLDRSGAAIRHTLASEHGRQGIITVGVVGAATFEVLPRLVEATVRRAPAIEFRFREMNARDQLKALEHGDIDVGLVRSEARSRGLEFKTVHVEPVVCLLPEGHPLAEKDEIQIPELEGEPILNLARDQDPAGHDFYVAIYRAAGFEPHIVQEVSQAATILFAISTLRCVGLGPASWRVLRRDGVVIKPVAPPAPTLTTRLVWKSSKLKSNLEALLEAAQEIAPSQKAASVVSCPNPAHFDRDVVKATHRHQRPTSDR